MRFQTKQLTLYAVTDRYWTSEITLYEQVHQALEGGVTCVQLREKNMDDQDFLKEAIPIRKLCNIYNVPLIINDNLEVALKSGADGIHVGQDDQSAAEIRAIAGKDFIIGVTAKTVEQAQKAQADGADYIGSGAIFSSPTKQGAVRITKDQLKVICDAVSIPVVAIGGIELERIPQLSGGGMAGVAVVSGLFSAPNIKKRAEELRSAVEKIITKQAVLTIAGSDSSGGAGIQADLKTMTMNGTYAMSVVTALTAQNTMGVTGIMESDPKFLQKQIDAVFEDIYPDAVKIGMVASAGLIGMIAERLTFYGAKNIVVDPVMVASSGSRLLKEDAIDVLTEELFPMAELVTPNIPEAEILWGRKIQGKDDMLQAAEAIHKKCRCNVLLKGGHRIHDANDLLYMQDGFQWIEGKRIDNPNTHGTGCTLSSAIAANLAKGYNLEQAIRRAKDYVSRALGAMMNLGNGDGPMDHAFDLKGDFA